MLPQLARIPYLTIILLSVFVVNARGLAADASNKPKLRLRIVVDQFKISELAQSASVQQLQQVGTRNGPVIIQNVTKVDINGLQAVLLKKLKDSGNFEVLEREKAVLMQANVEDRIDEARRADASVALPRREKRIPARYIITPEVTGFEATGSEGGGMNIAGFGTRKKSMRLSLSINLRIVDAETGAILETENATSDYTTSETSKDWSIGPVQMNSNQGKATPMNLVVDEALSEGVEKLSKRLSREPWTADVAFIDQTTGRIVINAGFDAGITEGLVLSVFNLTGRIVDPRSGLVISEGDEVHIGTLKVVRVQRQASFCEKIDGKGIEVGSVVKL